MLLFHKMPNGTRYANCEGVLVAMNNGEGWELHNCNIHQFTLDDVVNSWNALIN